MPYKPTGQLLGNVPDSYVESTTPSNRASVPGGITAQVAGTSFIGWGEGSDSSSVNRPLTALSRNTDYLRARMAAPIAVARTVDDTGIADLSVATATTDILLAPTPAVFDGWMYTGTVLADIDLYVRLINRDGSEARNSSGTRLIVSDIQTGAGVSMVGVAQTVASAQAILQPSSGRTHSRHFIKFSSTILNAQIGNATARGLRVAISGSTAATASKGTNNGNFVVVDGTGAGTEFVLAEFRYRVRHYNASGAFSVAETVTGGTSGASGVVTAASSDYLEFTAVTGTFRAGETITGGTSTETATVIRFTAPGDPVILNNDMSSTGIATFTTDGSWINTAFTSAPKVVLSGALGSASDLLLQIGGLTTLEQLGAGGFLSFGYSPTRGSLDSAYEIGRTVTADLGAITLNTATTAEALNIVRTSGSGSVSILSVKDGVTTYFAQVYDDAAADAPDYTYAYRLNTDLIRSYTYRKISTGATAAIGLGDASGNVALRSGNSGGTEVDILRARKASATGTVLQMMGPAGVSLASGDTATFSVTDQMSLVVTRNTNDIVWSRSSATRGVLDGGSYTQTNKYQYIAGNAETEGDRTSLLLNSTRGVALTSTYVKLLCMVVSDCDLGKLVVGEAVSHAAGGKGTIVRADVGYIEVLQTFRLSLSGVAGTFAVSNTITGVTSGATGTVIATDGATYVEYIPSLLTFTAENITSSAGGTAAATVSTGAWTGGSEVITGGSTGAKVTRISTAIGRSDTKVAKVSATYTDGNGTALLSLSPSGGLLDKDADRQQPLLTVPDLAYSGYRYLMVDVPITSLASRTGVWKPSHFHPDSFTSLPFGMQVSGAAGCGDTAFLSIPPFNAGVCSTVVTMDCNSTTARIKITASTGVFTAGHIIIGADSSAYGTVTASDNSTYIEYTPTSGMFTTELVTNINNAATASGKGIKAGDLVFVDSSLAPVGAVAEIFGNQARLLVVQGCAFSSGTLWRGGPTYSGIGTPNWKLTTASALVSVTHYDAKPRLAGVEVVYSGSLEGLTARDSVTFSLLRSTLTATSVVDTQSLPGLVDGEFGTPPTPLSLWLGASLAAPSADMAESYTLKVASYRLTISGVVGTFAVANTILGVSTGATGTITATDGATYIEYTPTLGMFAAENISSSAGGTAAAAAGTWTTSGSTPYPYVHVQKVRAYLRVSIPGSAV